MRNPVPRDSGVSGRRGSDYDHRVSLVITPPENRMMKKLLAASCLAVVAAGAQAQLPELSAAAAPAGSFLQIAAEAGQQVSTLANGEAATAKDADQSNATQAVIAAPPVPEPETYALMLAGLAAVGFVIRRRRA